MGKISWEWVFPCLWAEEESPSIGAGPQKPHQHSQHLLQNGLHRLSVHFLLGLRDVHDLGSRGISN